MSRQQEADDEESEEEFQEIAASEDNWECEHGGNGGDFEGSEDLDASGRSLDPKDDSDSESDRNQQKCSRVKSTSRRYADNRYYKRCPVPGCGSERSYKKVSMHIQRAHPQISEEERKKLLKHLKREPKAEVGKKKPRLLRGQRKMEAFLQQSPPVHSSLPECSGPSTLPESSEPPSLPEPSVPSSLPPERRGKKGSTRGFPKYNLDSKEIAAFRRFLESVDGKLKAPHVAKAIASDLSKFLKFCRPEAPLPDWSSVYQRQRVLDYLDHLKVAGGCSAESQLSWLDSVSQALRYVYCQLLPDQDPGHNTCLRLEKSIQAWKASLRKLKGVREGERRQEFLETPSSLQEVTDFTECSRLWQKYHSLVAAIRNGQKVSERDSNFCTVVVAALFLFSSWQRAGAVENCTMTEYQARMIEANLDGSKSIIIRVKRHKTDRRGPADLVLAEQHYDKLQSYVDVVRPYIDPTNVCPFLFVRCGPKKVTQISNRVKSVGKRFDVEAPTATRVRKIGSTAVALQCGTSKDARLITQQMSHTSAVHERYYEMVGSSSHTASAFQVMERLRKDEGKAQHTPRKRFTPQEENELKEYFAPAILSGSTPSLEECDEFLRGKEFQRSKKQIQDKIKNLIKSRK